MGYTKKQLTEAIFNLDNNNYYQGRIKNSVSDNVWSMGISSLNEAIYQAEVQLDHWFLNN